MQNSRLKYLRDEMERRLALIEAFETSEDPAFLDDPTPTDEFFLRVTSFVEFLFRSPEIAPEFRSLVRSDREIEKAEEIQEFLTRASRSILAFSKRVISTLDAGNLKVTIPHEQELRDWLKPEFKTFETRARVDEAWQKLGMIAELVAQEGDISSVSERGALYQERMKIDARSNVLSHYNAADSARVLQEIYEKVNFMASPHVSEDASVVENPAAYCYMRLVDGVPELHYSIEETRDHCRRLSNAILAVLDSRHTKATVVARFKQYCEWIKRTELLERLQGKTEKEAVLQSFIEEFLFQAGYFPIVQPKIGRALPDLLSQSSPDASMLIELKTVVGNKPLNNSRFGQFVAQTVTYANAARVTPEYAAAEVYLIVFHDKDKLVTLESDAEEDLDKQRVFVCFVSLGEKPPSKLKRVLRLSHLK